jgi:hypothetical protein
VTVVGGSGSTPPAIPNNTLAVTPAGVPNMISRTIPTARAVAIRAGNVFITVFASLTGIGAVAAGAVSVVGGHLNQMTAREAFIVAGTAALGEIVKSLGTILSGLEKKYPVATGNV